MKASDNGDDENYRDFYGFDDAEFSKTGRLPKWAGYSRIAYAITMILAICVGAWLVIAWAIRQCTE